VKVLIKLEVSQHEKDVRVAIVHFDLVCYLFDRRSCLLIFIAWQARTLVHLGALNSNTRPAQSIANPLGKLLKDFEVLIKEFRQFCKCVLASIHVLALSH
jgi:hypothetical protein